MTLQTNARALVVAAVSLLSTACVSAPQSVREQASSALACERSQVSVNRTGRRYLGDDSYEASGCGQKLAYQCERAYVLLIPVGTVACRQK